MDKDDILETTKAMRLEVTKILLNADLEKDKEAQKTIKTIKRMFERLDKDAAEVLPKETLKHFYDGVDKATHQLGGQGLDDQPHGKVDSRDEDGNISEAFKTEANMAAISQINDDLIGDMAAAIRTAKENGISTIQNTLDTVKEEMQSGQIRGKTRKKIQQRVAGAFAKDGLTSFTTRDGRKLPLDFYAETVTRTTLKKANTRGAANRYEENNVKRFTVAGNDPTCGDCAPYVGQIFTMDEDDREFTFMRPEDIHRHPNCQCSVEPYVTSAKSQEELDAAKQKSAEFDPDSDPRSSNQKQLYDKKQKHKAKNRYEEKRYAKIKGVLGDDAPKTQGAFKRMKRADSDNYKKLLRKYQQATKRKG